MTILPTSIRAKLTLTAVTVMGVLFVVLGLVVEVVGRQQILSGVDADLTRQANEIIQIHDEMEKHRPPFPGGQGFRPGNPGDNGPGGPDGGPNGDPPDQIVGRNGGDRPGADGRRPDDRGPDGRGHGPDRNGPPMDFQRAVQRVGDPLLAIQPHFVSITPGPPFARPDMMVPYDSTVLQRAERQGVVFSMAKIGEENVRLITKLAVDKNGRKWLVQYPHPLRDIDGALTELNQTLLILLPIGLLLTGMACLYLVKRIMKPIREITDTADSIRGEDMTRRLNVQGSDEFALLAGTMNGMLGRIEGAFTAQRQALERVEAVLKQQRRFTADASHELKTPLAVIKANTGLMLHGMSLDPDTASSVSAIDSAATRMNRLVQGLMVLARTESGQPTQTSRPFNLNVTILNAIDQVHCLPSKDVIANLDDHQVNVIACESDLERVFVNLIDNACRHTSETGKISIGLSREANSAVVSVRDDGEGIGPEHLPHLFDRFYRVDSARSSELGGTGLGLAICKGIVESHGGSISVTSELGKGATFTVKLPIESAP